MSAKSVPQPRIGRGPGINFEKSNEKLNNPKETTFRILKYIGNKRLSLMLIFVFCVITTLVSIMGTKLNGEIVDKYISVGDISGLFRICIVLIFMYLVATLSTFIQNRLMVSIAQKTSAEIRKDLYEKMQHLPLKYFDTHSSGDLMSRLTNDIDNINMTMSQSITQLISGVINIVGMLIAMLMLNKTLTIIGLITTPITILATRALVKCTQPLFVKKQSGLGHLNGYIEEMVSGQKAVLLFSQEEKVKKEFSEINKNITKLYFNGGKKKKLRAGDFVGAISKIEGITAEDIGIIDVQDTVSYVDILNGKGNKVIAGLKDSTIKGKKLRVEKAKR